MATTDLKIRPARETIVFRGIVNILREDPHLRTVLKSMQVWDGSEGDSSPITKTQLPSIQLTPGADAGAWEAVGLHREMLMIAVRMAVEGTDADNIMNLWGAVRSALFPQLDATQEAKLKARYDILLIGRPILMRPAINFDVSNADFKAIYANGMLGIPLLIPT